jgi:hypothetical protein
VALFGMGPDLDDVYTCLEFHSFLPAVATEEEAVRAVLLRDVAPPPAPVVEDESGSEIPHVDDVLGESPIPRVPPRERRHVEVAPSKPDDGSDVVPDPASLWGKMSWSGKGDGNGSDLDIASAQADRHVGRDEKLRALGWQKYGQRLKKRSVTGKLKDSGGGKLDPDEGADK